MSEKPEDVDQSAWDDAEFAVTGPRPTREDEWEMIDLVARAIMAATAAEREACAKVADANMNHGPLDAATAIRSRTLS